jgi:hypothetical protein
MAAPGDRPFELARTVTAMRAALRDFPRRIVAGHSRRESAGPRPDLAAGGRGASNHHARSHRARRKAGRDSGAHAVPSRAPRAHARPART